MRHTHLTLPLFILLAALLTACHYSQPSGKDRWAAEEGSVDSVAFRAAHHYWTGYNFQAEDTLRLVTTPPVAEFPLFDGFAQDTLTVLRGEKVVVAKVAYAPADTVDSVWVKVARDQLTQGWTRETDLLRHTVPDDPVSRLISRFSDRRSFLALCLLAAAVALWLVQTIRHKRLHIVHFRDIRSFYPTLLCLCVSGSATLYGSMQRFVPETWVEFYFHPTINPLSPDIPPILALFVASVWLTLITAVAVVEETRRQPDLGDTLAYLASLGGVCMVVYLLFTLTTPIYIGYALLPLYWAFAIRQYLHHQPSHLLCGVCNRPIPEKGRCPHCGAFNQ